MSKRKFWKGVTVGLVVGVGIATAGVAAADSQISAYLVDSMNFVFDGKSVAVPSDYQVLGYQGHTYVPARFIADQLGESVNWDANTRTISFTKNSNEFNPTGDDSSSSGTTGTGTTSTTSPSPTQSSSDPFSQNYSLIDGNIIIEKPHLVQLNHNDSLLGTYEVTWTVKCNYPHLQFVDYKLDGSFYDAQGNLLATMTYYPHDDGQTEVEEADSMGVPLWVQDQYIDTFKPSQVAKIVFNTSEVKVSNY